jgi:hypothetical protein
MRLLSALIKYISFQAINCCRGLVANVIDKGPMKAVQVQNQRLLFQMQGIAKSGDTVSGC